MHFVLDFVRQSIPPSWQLRNGWYSGNCQMCRHRGHPRGDKKKRGGINITESGLVYNCFNCGFKCVWSVGSPITSKLKFMLRQGFGVTEESIHRLQLQMMREKERENFLKVSPEKEQPYVIQWPDSNLPGNSKPFSRIDIDSIPRRDMFVKALEMIVERRLDFWRDWYYSSSPAYSSRLILPFRYQSRIVGYTARDVTGKGTPKYRSHQPENFIFNLDNQHKRRRYVIVCEGPFDAMCVDGIAICGNSISHNQAKIINQLNKEVIVVPDSGSLVNKGNLVQKAIHENWSVSFPAWPAGVKDINKAVERFGRYFVLQSILSARTDNTTRIKILEKTW